MGNKIRAKFFCQSTTAHAYGGKDVFLTAVSGKPGEKMNEDAGFNKATPSGEVKMRIDNPAAVDFFQPGKSYYLDFEEAGE